MATNPRYLARVVHHFGWIIPAIRHEFLEFRYDYPLEITPDAYSPRTADYYLYSNRLFLQDLEFDDRGVAMKRYRAQGLQYNPLFIAWWGLFNLQQYLRFRDDKDLQKFFIQIEW